MLEDSVGHGQEFIVDALWNFEPMQGTQVRSDMMMLGDLVNNPSKTVLDKLKTS